MRKGITESNSTTPLTLQMLRKIEDEGFKFVQVKGLTLDKHYDYVEPHFLVLVPMKELPLAQDQKDVYEPLPSSLLKQWATEADDALEIVVSTKQLS